MKNLLLFFAFSLCLFACSDNSMKFGAALPPASYTTIDPKDFGAIGDGITDDYPAIQKALDVAISRSGTLYMPLKYRISKTIIAAKWDSIAGNYVTFTVKIKGESTTWDINSNSVITATFKNGPGIAIYRCKGCVIDGINLQGSYRTPLMSDSVFYNSNFDNYGDTTCRDSRNSPYAGIAIDAFSSTLPADSGYPALRSWYRGTGSGGSTRCEIKNTTVNNFTVGIIYSPTGLTANCDNMLISGIRTYNSKAFFVGCQAQEKSNRITDVICWGRTHTFLSFGSYGAGAPGFYYVDGLQIAGGVVRLIRRESGGYYPIYINNVFAESLGQIGYWGTEVNDRLSNAVIQFSYPSITKSYPVHLQGRNVTFDNCMIRYYGQPKLPIAFVGKFNWSGRNIFDQPIITGARANDAIPGYTTKILGFVNSCRLPSGQKLPPGSNIIFGNANSYPIEGLATVGSDSVTLENTTSSILSGWAAGKSNAVFVRTNN